MRAWKLSAQTPRREYGLRYPTLQKTQNLESAYNFQGQHYYWVVLNENAKFGENRMNRTGDTLHEISHVTLSKATNLL